MVSDIIIRTIRKRETMRVLVSLVLVALTLGVVSAAPTEDIDLEASIEELLSSEENAEIEHFVYELLQGVAEQQELAELESTTFELDDNEIEAVIAEFFAQEQVPVELQSSFAKKLKKKLKKAGKKLSKKLKKLKSKAGKLGKKLFKIGKKSLKSLGKLVKKYGPKILKYSLEVVLPLVIKALVHG